VRFAILLALVACRAPNTDPTRSFWSWFADHGAELRAEPDIRTTMERITAELAKVDPGVVAEIGTDGADRQLVLTADGKRANFPGVQKIYAARPTVPGWTIVAFRQRPKPGSPPLRIDLAGGRISPDDVKFIATPSGSQLDVVLYIPMSGSHDELGTVGFLLLDHTIGEYDSEMKVGQIDFATIDKAPANARPLTALPAVVDGL